MTKYPFIGLSISVVILTSLAISTPALAQRAGGGGARASGQTAATPPAVPSATGDADQLRDKARVDVPAQDLTRDQSRVDVPAQDKARDQDRIDVPLQDKTRDKVCVDVPCPDKTRTRDPLVVPVPSPVP